MMILHLTQMLNKLKVKQAKLDSFIFKKHDTNHRQTFRLRIISFLVELNEFYNEERSFKFWSNRPASNLEVLLDEYIDALHFLLSVSCDINFNFEVDLQTKPWSLDRVSPPLSKIYLMTTEATLVFEEDPSTQHFRALFWRFWQIAEVLQFNNVAQIQAAYARKYAVNFDRQNHNY